MSHYFTNDINLKHNIDKKNVVINNKCINIIRKSDYNFIEKINEKFIK